MSLRMAWVVVVIAGCGPPPTRAELGVHPEAEGVCSHEGQTMLLSKYQGGLCGTNPAPPSGEPVPTCDALAATMGCQ